MRGACMYQVVSKGGEYRRGQRGLREVSCAYLFNLPVQGRIVPLCFHGFSDLQLEHVCRMLDHFKRDVRIGVEGILFVMFTERRSFHTVFRCSDVLSGRSCKRRVVILTNILLVAQLARCSIDNEPSIMPGAGKSCCGRFSVPAWLVSS